MCSSLPLDGLFAPKEESNFSDIFKDNSKIPENFQNEALFQSNLSFYFQEEQKNLINLLFWCKNFNSMIFIKLSLIKYIYPILVSCSDLYF